MKKLYEKINEKRDVLNKSEQDIAQYILANESLIISLKLQELAEKCFVSKTSVIRLCKKLDFDGYKSMQYFLKAQQNNVEFTISEEKEILTKQAKGILDNVHQTLSHVNYDSIKEIAELICSCRRIDIYGLASSRYICQDFARKLNMLGIWANAAYEEEMIYLQASKLDKDNLAFVVTLTGNNDVLVDSIEVAKKRDATTISLTNNTMNQCASSADIPLYVQVNMGTVQYNRYRPRYIFMIIIEMIIEECIKILDYE